MYLQPKRSCLLKKLLSRGPLLTVLTEQWIHIQASKPSAQSRTVEQEQLEQFSYHQRVSTSQTGSKEAGNHRGCLLWAVCRAVALVCLSVHVGCTNPESNPHSHSRPQCACADGKSSWPVVQMGSESQPQACPCSARLFWGPWLNHQPL